MLKTRNTKQEFPCQSLESLSGEYYNMKNKILDFKMKQKSRTTTDAWSTQKWCNCEECEKMTTS